MKKEHIPGLGTKLDSQRRAELWVCDRVYQHKIKTAWKIIYKKGYVVNSKAVDKVIGSQSFTPTRVSQGNYLFTIADCVAECIYFHPFQVWAGLFLPLCCGPHA